MDGWVKIDGNQLIKYVNNQNIVSVNDVGGGVVATMRNGDTVRLTELPPDKPTAKSYVQDGLVAMWDGIENAGWRVHDSKATYWRNLAHDQWHLTYNTSNAEITPTSLHIDGAGYGAVDIKTGPAPDIWAIRTVEVVFKWDKVSRHNAHFIFSANPYPGEVNTIAGSIGKGFFWEGNSKLVADIRNETSGHTGKGILSSKYVANSVATVSADFGDTFNGGVARMTLNGSSTGATSGAARISRGYFRIGGATSNGYGLTNGDIYCVRVYNRVLPADETAHNYAIDKERFGLT